MPLRKIGKYYYIDIRIRETGKRIRKSLDTTNKTEAIEKYQREKSTIIAEALKKEVKLNDFCKQYIDWAVSSKPASVLREKQRLQKNRGEYKSWMSYKS